MQARPHRGGPALHGDVWAAHPIAHVRGSPVGDREGFVHRAQQRHLDIPIGAREYSPPAPPNNDRSTSPSAQCRLVRHTPEYPSASPSTRTRRPTDRTAHVSRRAASQCGETSTTWLSELTECHMSTDVGETVLMIAVRCARSRKHSFKICAHAR